MNTLLKFSASWCQPCKALSSVLKTIDLSSFELVEIDVDKQPEIAKAHQVRAVPTLILIGEETNMENKRCTGAKTRLNLLQFLGLDN